MELSLVYHFQSSQNEDGIFRPASYKVVYFFSSEGFLDIQTLRELSKAVPDANHEDLTFLNLDDLKTFALRVSQEMRAQDVRLISVQDYNIGIDGARDLPAFQSIFQKFGELVENEDAPRKKSLFGRLFS
jgi:hypothetical protein